MKPSLKSFLRPLILNTIAGIEPVVGFWTDPTGYVPNRVKMLTGRYEKFLTESICQALSPNGVFVDAGANVGFISQQVARRFPQVRVYTFEPNPRIHPLLQKNLKAFPNCELFHAGLGAREGWLEFFHGEESCVGSFVQEYTRQHPSNQRRGSITTSQVQITTGDTVLARVGSIDAMKMDVEGYEIEVLRGMSQLLARRAVKTIFFEFCPFAHRAANHPPAEIIDLLTQSGYVVFEMEGASAGASVNAQNIAALIARLGDKGYTTLRANVSVPA